MILMQTNISVLWPQSELAVLIIALQVLTFFVWVAMLIGSASRLFWVRKKIESINQLVHLTDLIRRRFEVTTAPDHEPTEPVPTQDIALQVFDSFCEAENLGSAPPLVKHLKAIFLTGFKEGMLDANSLIKATNRALIGGIAGFRSVLSVFIVLGLLGTLYGLATSLSDFANLLPAGENLTQQTLSVALTSLLPKLGGAFSTSLCGVTFTVLGVILLSLHQHRFVAPVTMALESQTLTNWVPELVTTPAQRLLEKLQLSEKQMQKNFEAAQKVAEFADQIRDDASDLTITIKNARTPLKALRESSEHLASFAEHFIQSVHGLTQFQEDLQNLYGEMRETSIGFHRTIESLASSNARFQATADSRFLAQTQEVTRLMEHHELLASAITNSLKVFEAEFLAEKKSIDAVLVESIAAAKNAYSVLGNQNKVLAEAVGTSIGLTLNDRLESELGAMNNTLEDKVAGAVADSVSKLRGIENVLNKLDAPLVSASNKFTGSLENFDKRISGLFEELKTRFEEQIKKSQGQLDELAELGQSLNTINSRLEQMAGLGETIDQLNGSVSGLTKTVDNLAEKASRRGSIFGWGR
ncbi:MAG: hypothetical protein R2684_13170 [Pyrinomonadaceae bacterium]